MGYEREKVAERLADLRKERKLSLEKLSKAIEEKTGVYISGPQLNKYENTERVKKGKIEKITDIMSAENAVTIADFYGVSYDYILGQSDARNQENHSAVEETGLSEKAISKLKNWHEREFEEVGNGMRIEVLKNTKAPEELSKIIESNHFGELISLIRWLKYSALLSSNEEGFQEQIETPPGAAKVKALLSELGKKATQEYVMFLILNTFRDIIKEIVPLPVEEDKPRDATQADIDDLLGY